TAAPRGRRSSSAARSGNGRSPVPSSAGWSSRHRLQHRYDRLPGAGLPRAHKRSLNRDVVEGRVEARLVGLTQRDGVEELVVLDRDQILEPDPVRAAGDEVAVVREAVAAEAGRVAGVRLVARDVDTELVQALEVPRRGAVGAVDVEGHLALGPDEGAGRLERAVRAVLEAREHRRVVLVRDGAGGVARAAAAGV